MIPERPKLYWSNEKVRQRLPAPSKAFFNEAAKKDLPEEEAPAMIINALELYSNCSSARSIFAKIHLSV